MFINNSQRPIGLMEILAKSWRIYRNNLLTISLITLIINVPINLAVSVMPSYPFEAILTQKYELGDLKYIFILLAIQLLFAPIGTMAVAYVTREALENKKIDVVSGLNASFFKWFGMITASLIFLAIIAVSSLTIVLPVYFLNVYSFYTMVVILSGQNGYQALKYSKGVVFGRWFKVLFYWIVLFLLNQGVLIMLSTVLIGFTGNIVTQMICDSVLSVISAYFVCVQAVWYLNLEATRKTLDNNTNSV